MVRRPVVAVLLCVLICAAMTSAAAAPGTVAQPGQVALVPSAVVSGVLELDSLHVASGDVLVYSGETTVRARGDIVIDGTLLGSALAGDPAGTEPGTLHLESDGRIVVSGTVRGGSGRSGSLAPAALAVIEDAAWSDPSVAVRWFGSKLTVEQAGSLLETALTAERLVRLGLEDVGEAFAGGAGGSIVLSAPLVLIDGQVIGGSGGDGGPGGRGGAGGRVMVHGACLTRESGEEPRILGGNGGRGGRASVVTARGADGRGGNGGDALCLGNGFDPDVLALLIEAQPPGSSQRLRGVGAQGGDGGAGADGVHVGVLPSGMVRRGDVVPTPPGGASEASPGTAGVAGVNDTGPIGSTGSDGPNTSGCQAPNGGNGSNGGTGGTAIGGDGGPGGEGRSGCPSEPGKNGGKGGPGGKGTGGQGGQGGNGGLGQFHDCPVICCGKGGNGGTGGPGGSGSGGRKGLGGNGGAGCGPGLAGEAGRRGTGVAGIGGNGGGGGGGGAGPGNNGANGNNGAQADGGDPMGLSADGVVCAKCP